MLPVPNETCSIDELPVRTHVITSLSVPRNGLMKDVEKTCALELSRECGDLVLELRLIDEVGGDVVLPRDIGLDRSAANEAPGNRTGWRTSLLLLLLKVPT